MTVCPQGETAAGGADRRAGPAARNLALRTVSAIVLAPIVVAAAYAGGWYFFVLCGLGAGGVLWEWTRLVTGRSDPKILAPGSAALFAALACTGIGAPVAAAAAIAAGTVLAGALAGLAPADSGERLAALKRGLWAAGGVLYAGTAFLGPALLRRSAEFGFLAFLFLAAAVWTTDICAYAVGRAVGGPRLWRRVSPSKTWAGAAGGLAGGVAAGTLVAYASGIGSLAVPAMIALLLSALAQAGDLLESAVKRQFGAKDASGLIPGHGGLMDRVDGFLVAAAVALLIGVLHQGTGAPAHGLLVW